jgi:hypothetical protein
MTLVDAALAAHADVRVRLGMLAVYPTRYMEEGVDAGGPSVEGLVVRSHTTGHRALFHPSTGVYGFVDLPPGAHRIDLVDPARRWLDRTLHVTVSARGTLREDLQAGLRPLVVPAVTSAEVPMRPAVESVDYAGATVLRGWVCDDGGRPVALALVRVELDLSAEVPPVLRRWSTWTDVQGNFVFVMRDLERIVFEPVDESPPEDPEDEPIPDVAPAETLPPRPSVSLVVSVWRPSATVSRDDPLEALPVDIDDVASELDPTGFVDRVDLPPLELELGREHAPVELNPITLST